MQRFVILITVDEIDVDNPGDLCLNKLEYIEFKQQAELSGLLSRLQREITATCNSCNGYIVKAKAFFDAVDAVHLDTDFPWELYDQLTEVVPLTDDEWTNLLKEGQNSIPALKGRTVIYDDDGNARRFVSEEILITFDENCVCRKIFAAD